MMEVHPTIEYPQTMNEYRQNEWLPIDPELAEYCLEVLPPIRWKANAFMVGEALCYLLDRREQCYDTVCKVDGQNFLKPCYLSSFDPSRYTAEIRAQLATYSPQQLPE